MLLTGLFTCLSHFIFCVGKKESEYKTRVAFSSKKNLQFFINYKDSNQRTEQDEISYNVTVT